MKREGEERRETRTRTREDRTFPIIWMLPMLKRARFIYSNVFIISGQIEIGYFFFGIIIRRINEFVRGKSNELNFRGTEALCFAKVLRCFCFLCFKIMRRDKYICIKTAYLLNKLINYLINLNIPNLLIFKQYIV